MAPSNLQTPTNAKKVVSKVISEVWNRLCLGFSSSRRWLISLTVFHRVLVIMGAAFLLGVTVFGFWLGKKQDEHAATVFATANDLIVHQEYPAALKKLDEAILIKPKGIYYYEKYLVLSAMNNYYEARMNLDKALELDSNNATIVYDAAHFYLSIEDDEESGIRYLKRSVELEPQNSDYRLEYGTTLAEYGQYSKGIAILEKLLKDDPNYTKVWNNLATLYQRKGDLKKALTTRILAFKKFPNDAYHCFWLANTYDTQNNPKKAVEFYQKSIVLDPETGSDAAYRIKALTGKTVPERYREVVEDSIPVEYRNTHAFIHATINGHAGVFLLDTGATDSFISPAFLERSQLIAPDNSITTRYSTGNGEISVPVFYADIKVGRFNIDNARVAVPPTSQMFTDMDGIIGMNILKNFVIKIDNRGGTLIFSRA